MKCITHRKNSIYQTTIIGKTQSKLNFLTEMTIFLEVARICNNSLPKATRVRSMTAPTG
jgi:UbiD family decarboxylase